MRNIKLLIRFDGSSYHGWQIQPNGTTVQEKIIEAVSAVTGEKSNVIGCSRTDAGVHALGYVCSFKTETKIPSEKFSYAINSKLPKDIVCIKSEEAAESFHAINSAKSKRYIYKIENSTFPDPFNAGRTWHIKGSLDFESMKKAAEHFKGTHDFLGFAAAGFTAKTTVRTIFDINVLKDGNILTVDVTGDGFLYNMVRIITGTLVWVGMGKINPDNIPEIIKSKKRENAGITAPPDGLYLWGVNYT